MKIHVELLLGRRVHDVNGRVVGHIRALAAVREGAFCYVTEFHLGTAALLERLGISSARMIGLPIRREPLRVPWQLLDLSDPERPRLTVAREQLR